MNIAPRRLAVVKATNAIVYARSRLDPDAWETAALLCEEAEEPYAHLCRVMARLVRAGERPHVVQPHGKGGGLLVAYKNRDGRMFVVESSDRLTEVNDPQLRKLLDQYEEIANRERAKGAEE